MFLPGDYSPTLLGTGEGVCFYLHLRARLDWVPGIVGVQSPQLVSNNNDVLFSCTILFSFFLRTTEEEQYNCFLIDFVLRCCVSGVLHHSSFEETQLHRNHDGTTIIRQRVLLDGLDDTYVIAVVWSLSQHEHSD